jgi:hypothetical protein
LTCRMPVDRNFRQNTGWPRGECRGPLLFDVQNGKPLVRDDEGAEFDSLEAAVYAAAGSVAEIGTSRLARGDTSAVVIEVRDEQNQRVCTVTASTRIERHGPSHQGPHSWSA